MADSTPALSSYFTDAKPRFVLLYGSETGNAEAITAEMVDQAAQKGLQADRYELNATDRKFNIERERCVVIVTSTTGEGDPPENAVKFMKRITKRTLPNDYLKEVNITLLGLGDSNYSSFCNCGKTLWSTVMELGAKEFYPPGWADDATGLEAVVDPWIEGLWEPLKETLKAIRLDEKGTNVMNGSGDGPDNVVGMANGDVEKTVDIKTVITSNDDDEVAAKGISDMKSCDCTLCQSTVLSSKDLTVPLLGPDFLRIAYKDDQFDTSKIPILNGMHLPSSASKVVMATVSKVTQLTSDDALKKALDFELDVSGTDFKYEPGDSFSIVCSNESNEVQKLLEMLEVAHLADLHYVLTIDPDTKKRGPAVPKHVPSEGTLRHTLTHCCDIRGVPKKAFLRVLVEATSSETEKRRLQELCSKEGQSEFAQFLRGPNIGLPDILHHFKTCKPKIERILEHLTPLTPRPYSASSSNLAKPGKLNFVFNVVNIDASDGRAYERKGVCTGRLEKYAKVSRAGALETQMESLNLDKVEIPIFMRTNNHFHLPEDPELPIIMIGPGTGVAPFMGFLSHRQKLVENGSKSGKMWLFFGCRHREKDYFYKNEIRKFTDSGILTKSSVCFSRERTDSDPKYVQDLMQMEKESLVEWLDSGANVFVCGDAKNMAKEVFEKFVSLYSEVKSVGEKDGRSFMMTKRLKKSYHEDVWTS